MAFSPDGKKIVSGGWDKTLRLWDVSWESWLQTACNQLRHHSSLVNPTTDEAKEAKKTCQSYVWQDLRKFSARTSIGKGERLFAPTFLPFASTVCGVPA